MRITELKYMERINLGNFEHSELSATAIITEDENVNTAILALKTFVKNGLVSRSEAPVVEQKQEIKEVVVEKKKEEKVAEAPKVEAEVVKKEKKPKKEKATYAVYNPENQTHKEILRNFLDKKYQSAWKVCAPKEEIQSFTATLKGLEFIDDSGLMAPSFIEYLQTFFGA